MWGVGVVINITILIVSGQDRLKAAIWLSLTLRMMLRVEAMYLARFVGRRGIKSNHSEEFLLVD